MTRHLTQPEFNRGVSLVTAVTASLHVLRAFGLPAFWCLLLLAAGSWNVDGEKEEEEEEDDEGLSGGSQNTWLWVWMTAGAELWPVSVRMDKLMLAAGLERKLHTANNQVARRQKVIRNEITDCSHEGTCDCRTSTNQNRHLRQSRQEQLSSTCAENPR